ncbi:hypothetical protein KBZ08_00760 [Cyanobium sp. Candia 9D4]|uniref:hypothetical protein n=1 Tax=Cyanobium sp. Candia 9D4 TaxID=2823707 RepID=UPI0020CDBF2D|nr:hypothetical protein [Cyanobium sp. Candia 9D4]MCP9932440.1 hypothetical protein [Cyanobium sp. Candia 9D4]
MKYESNDKSFLDQTEFEAILRDINSNWKERQKQLQAAHAAAAAGTGPQPYDRDWIDAGCDFSGWIEDEDTGPDWYVTNDLLEGVNWALASPQGQRALAMKDDELSPWQHTLAALFSLQEALRTRQRSLLIRHAEYLGYSVEMLDVLENPLYDG